MKVLSVRDGILLILLLSTGFLVSPTPAFGQMPLVVLSAPDTGVAAGQTEAYVDVYLTNYSDTIAGFQFQLRSERPDLITFNFDNGGFDTSGTLVSGFEYVQAVDTSGTGHLLWFRCIANADPFDGYNTPGIAPQQGGVAVRIPVNAAANPDPTDGLSSPLTIIKPFDFSDPWGVSLGVITDTLTDTIYYQCTQWLEDSCLEWIMVDGYTEPYDSVYIYTYLQGYLDTTVVIPDHGQVTVEIEDPVSCDLDGDGTLTIVDLTCLIELLFGTPDPAACPNGWCETDGDEETTVADLTWLVMYLFGGAG